MAYTCIGVIIFALRLVRNIKLKKQGKNREISHPWIRSKKFPQLEPEISKRIAIKYEVANADNYLSVLKVTRSQ